MFRRGFGGDIRSIVARWFLAGGNDRSRAASGDGVVALARVEGIDESRRGTVSMFDGPPPSVMIAETTDHEVSKVAGWIKTRLSEGGHPHDIAIFVRSEAEVKRARAAVNEAGQQSVAKQGAAAIGTMHFAKGLEFRFVAVMACDEEIISLQSRIETVTDEADLKEVYETERHLLYVASTRTWDLRLVSCVEPASEFLDDFRRST